MNFKKPLFVLINGFIPFTFVIPPSDLKINQQQTKNSINIIDVGEVLKDGNREALRFSFSGFFPNIDSSHYSFLNPLPPKACEEYLRFLMIENKSLKFVVPFWLEYIKCKIDYLEFTYKDHTGNLHYQISLVEDREGMSTALDLATGLYKRASGLVGKGVSAVKGLF